MSSQPTTPEVSPVDEELVAYLDGELDADSRASVERRLADEAAFRTRLRLLQRTWDALDVLGRTDVDQSFTRTTVELVAVKAAQDIQQEQSRAVRTWTWSWIAWTACALASAAAGWLLLSQILARPNRQLVRDLRVIQRVDEYRNAGNFEFIKALDESSLFAADLEGELAATGATSLSGAAPSEETYNDRVRWIESLPPEQKAKLVQRNERFEALSPQERELLRQLHEQIAGEPRSKRLLGVLDRFNQWLKALSPAEQAELMSLAIDKRLAKIKEIQQLQVQSHFWDLAGRLEQEDLDTIFAWMEDYVSRNQGEILSKIDPSSAARILSTPDPRSRRRMLVWTVFGSRRSQGSSALPTPFEEDFRMLAARLSPTLESELRAQKSDEDRRDLVMTCARFAWNSRFAPPTPNDEELRKFYATLEPTERERVEKLEPQPMKRELTRLYHQRRFREGGWRPPGASGPSGRPFGPPRGDSSQPRREGEGRSSGKDGNNRTRGPERGADGEAKAPPSEKS